MNGATMWVEPTVVIVELRWDERTAKVLYRRSRGRSWGGISRVLSEPVDDMGVGGRSTGCMGVGGRRQLKYLVEE